MIGRIPPRLSGVQIKAPMYLDPQGILSPATGRPFTHILKPAGTSGFEAPPVLEWLAMELGRAVGFTVPAAALVAIPDGMPALVVERFDIRVGVEDRRLIALEDFCSVMDLPASAKYNGTIERLARAVRPLSTSPDEDLLILFKRALFAWLIADGDMHMKNLAFLKTAEPGMAGFQEARMAPLYDAVTTRVFPRLENDRLALKVNGKDDRLSRSDFRTLAATMGLKAGEADDAIAEMRSRLAAGLDRLHLPGFDSLPHGSAMRDRMFDIVRVRLVSLNSL
jgi:serine/threonine-protein kinase HipA